ncbi:MAG: rhamnogalacturonan lyase [Prevotella sp.]|nr:rhamnogalacturonan lyase [Prevotella sp.]
MKKIILFAWFALVAVSAFSQKPNTPVSQMEKLDRGLVAIPGTNGKCFLSWRLLGTDNQNTTFRILKNGSVLRDDITGATSFQVTGSSTDKFQVVTLQNGVVTETSPEVVPWKSSFLQIPLDRPAGGTISNWRPYDSSTKTYGSAISQEYTYSPNDCSVGDVDGDGQYEIFVKWDPSTSQDNSIGSGNSGSVYIDCYKLDGTKLWRIDLGNNIRAGAHYTQFLVYDFDKDGKAELMCKTAPGSKDGAGNYVNQAATNEAIKAASNTKDWRVSGGRIDGGHEYLTVFNGLTGAAVHTIAYYPNRNAKAELSEATGTFNWDDRSGKSDKGNYGNRGERYLAAVAYLGGANANPSGVFMRGYYTYAYVWAVDFDGQQLKHRWLHRSDSKTQYSVVDANMNESAKITAPASSSGLGKNTMYANGNHNLSVADVDGDGKDEIVWGSATVDDDGKLLYAVGFGHGDAMHLGDLNPDRPGLELFQVHEEKGTYAWHIHDAATGEIIWKGGQSEKDNGRGLAADIVGDSRGYEFWSSYGGFNTGSRNQNPFSAVSGTQVSSTKPSMNFRIYWDGDEYDELLDGITITKFPSSTALAVGRTSITGQSNNSTKATPCLSADIFGDWREELILRNSSNDALNIFSTVIPTDYRVPTLMHDHTYRMGICWQNVAYNQPPHLGYYLPDFIESFQGADPTGIIEVSDSRIQDSSSEIYNLQGQRVEKASHGIFLRGGKKYVVK